MTYCTLLKSNYLDKGIVTMRSLLSVAEKAEIYVLCMDALCKEILEKVGLERVHLISLEAFEDADLLAVKPKRSEAEYCWTCTAKLIRYVITKFSKEYCTYIDADLCFYADPQTIIDEMRSKNAVVSTVEHHFPPTRSGKRLLAGEGWNCVQFITFTNEPGSLELLDDWICKCLNECSVKSGGDQRYTNAWKGNDSVSVSTQYGAGVAPWNVSRYKLQNREKLCIKDRFTKKSYPLIFYHFQRLIYFDRWHVNIEPMPYTVRIDKKLLKHLYYPYIQALEATKRELETSCGYLPMVSAYVSDNMGQKKSFGQMILKLFSIPPMETLDVVTGKALKILRKKETYVDVREIDKN